MGQTALARGCDSPPSTMRGCLGADQRVPPGGKAWVGRLGRGEFIAEVDTGDRRSSGGGSRFPPGRPCLRKVQRGARSGGAAEPGRRLRHNSRVNVIARLLGFNLLSSVASRLPPRVAMVVQLVLVLVGSLLPLWPLARGWIELQDLLIYSCLWLAFSVAGTLVRLRTITTQTEATGFFALHYSFMVGIFAVVCGVWAVVMLLRDGVSGGWMALVPTALAVLLANVWSLADGWFLRGGRSVARVWQVLLPGYLRLAPVLFGTVAGAFLTFGDYPMAYRHAVAVALVVSVAFIDLALAIASYRLISLPVDGRVGPFRFRLRVRLNGVEQDL